VSAAQIALLRRIAWGRYIPHCRKDYSILIALYRRRYIRYGWNSVEVTEQGKEALVIHQQKEATA
jgi:hypothetical protein